MHNTFSHGFKFSFVYSVVTTFNADSCANVKNGSVDGTESGNKS